MLVTEYLQLPGYTQIEEELFSINESLELINMYDIMNSIFSKDEKLLNINMLIKKYTVVFGIKKKIMILVLFCMLNTTFGYSIIQENEKFRKCIFNKYEEFIKEEDEQPDHHFINLLKTKKI